MTQEWGEGGLEGVAGCPDGDEGFHLGGRHGQVGLV